MRRLLPLFLSLCLLTPAASAGTPEPGSLRTGGTAGQPSGQPATPGGELQALRAAAATGGSVKVIVGLRLPIMPEGRLSAAERSSQRSRIAAASTSFQARHAGPIRKRPNAFRAFEAIPYVAMEVTPQELAALAADPAVDSIRPNRVNRPMLVESTALIRAPQAWTMGFSGAGQTVAIIDTGVDKTHPFLAGKVIGEACFSLDGWCPGGRASATGAGAGMPCPGECDHGTHVAGIAVGKGSSFSGVAKDARLAAIQVFSPSDDGPIAYDSDILAGLQWVQDNAAALNIVAVNMSLGGGRAFRNCDDEVPAITAMINSLVSRNVATVIASGNEYYKDSIAFPACISSSISVGSVSDRDWGNCWDGKATTTDKVACYSNSSRILSLLAPGSVINSSVPGGGYAGYHGTSMATPHVAGAWAVLRSASPKASVSEILAALKSSGKPVKDYRNRIVKPRIDVAAALDLLVPPLNYTLRGKSAGRVTFAGGGRTEICTSSCKLSFSSGTTVQVTAEGVAGTVFKSWRGVKCTTPSCSVTMNGPVAISAEFSEPPRYELSYRKVGKGTGSVSILGTGANATCRRSCSISYNAGTTVTLTAMAERGSSFSGWSGACAGTEGNLCALTMDGAKSVTATFSVSTPAAAQLSAR